jgi:nucleoside-diphosphate-sugar epimerase
MARVVLFIPDLLFGSNVLGALQSAGHDPVLVGDADSLARELNGAQVLVVDLTADAAERLEWIEGIPWDVVRTLAFYSHVEADVRTQAERAGFDLVVPRSRMAREGPSLVARLLETGAID